MKKEIPGMKSFNTKFDQSTSWDVVAEMRPHFLFWWLYNLIFLCVIEKQASVY